MSRLLLAVSLAAAGGCATERSAFEDMHPNPVARCETSLVYDIAARAEQLCLACLEWGPDVPECNNALGLLAFQKRDLDASRTYFQRAIVDQHDDPLFHRNLAIVELEDGDLDEAERELLLAKQLDPNDERVDEALVVVRERRAHRGSLELSRPAGPGRPDL